MISFTLYDPREGEKVKALLLVISILFSCNAFSASFDIITGNAPGGGVYGGSCDDSGCYGYSQAWYEEVSFPETGETFGYFLSDTAYLLMNVRSNITTSATFSWSTVLPDPDQPINISGVPGSAPPSGSYRVNLVAGQVYTFYGLVYNYTPLTDVLWVLDVTNVPIPAPIFMLIPALLGLFAYRRKIS